MWLYGGASAIIGLRGTERQSPRGAFLALRSFLDIIAWILVAFVRTQESAVVARQFDNFEYKVYFFSRCNYVFAELF
jgi:hypothetical protein